MRPNTNFVFSVIVLIAIAILMMVNFVHWGVGKHTTERTTMTPGHPPAKLILSEAEWKKRLTPEQFKVMRLGGTEPPFAGKYVHFDKKGIYDCSACGLPLFRSQDKYDSGTGWPSFTRPISAENVILKPGAYSAPGKGIEVLCARCESHLGHVFNDGPPPTGKRYCINSIALIFVPAVTS